MTNRPAFKIGVVSYRGVGQSAIDRFRYDPLVRELTGLGHAISYFDDDESCYDVVIVPLKKKTNIFPGIRSKAPLIIGDVTDDILSYPITWYNWLGRYLKIYKRYYPRRYYLGLLQQCDWVVVGSTGQAESLRNYVSGVSVVTDAILATDNQYTASYRQRKPCRLVWFGNPVSLYGLATIQSSLDELAKTGNYELDLVTSAETRFFIERKWPRNAAEFMARQQIPCRFQPWSPATYARDIAGGDIALVPVEPDTGYNMHKPAGRVLLAMALGLPVVASAIPAYEAVIEPGQTGYIAHSPEDWILYINQLAQDPHKRQAMGLAARQFSLSNYNERTFGQRYREVIHRIVSAL